MEEVAFFIAEGNPADKHSQESVAFVSSFQTPQQYASFRQADCPRHGAALTGVGPGERLFTTSKSKALLNVYSWGKGIDQRIAVPEQLECLSLVSHPSANNGGDLKESGGNNLPLFRVPWLLAGGSKSGRIYIWELALGNLLCVKDAHYQGISVIKFSDCGTFLVSGGEDARVMVWRTLDLISVYNEEISVKPFTSFTDHTLSVTDLIILSSGIINDLKLYTVSRDSTLRVYDIMTSKLLTTYITSVSIECITKDPANRSLYIGLTNGSIRTIPLYQINPNTSVLESVGGNSKIITLDHDPNLTNTFVHHQQKVEATASLHKSLNKTKDEEDKPISVTCLDISMDGTSLISGDSAGRVFVSDIVTRQVVKSFPPCNSSISFIQTFFIPQHIIDNNNPSNNNKSDKKHRLIPPFKRVLASSKPSEHVLNLEIPADLTIKEESFDDWLNNKAQEELQFQNLGSIDSSITLTSVPKTNDDSARIQDLESKLAAVSEAYTDLRSQHEKLIDHYSKKD